MSEMPRPSSFKFIGDDRPKRLGWAPGSYLSKCHSDDCKLPDRMFTGDKRAIMCADCAYAVTDEDLARMEHERQLNIDCARIEEAVNTIVEICHRRAAHWWIDPETGADLREKDLIVPTKLMLVVSEVSEAMEADRKDSMDDKVPNMLGVVVEMADALIRLGDLAGAKMWQLGAATAAKMRVNDVRPDHKAENRKKKGGKKY